LPVKGITCADGPREERGHQLIRLFGHSSSEIGIDGQICHRDADLG